MRALKRATAVIVSDYGSGLITPELWKRAFAAARLRKPPVVLVDSRYALAAFSGMTACTPNEPEVEALARDAHRRRSRARSSRPDAACCASSTAAPC